MPHQVNRPIPREEAIVAYLSGVSLDALRKKYGVCSRRLKRILQRRGVPVRDRGGARRMLERMGRPKPEHPVPQGLDLDALRRLYASGLGLPSVARALGFSVGKLRGWLRRCGIQERTLLQSAQQRAQRRRQAAQRRLATDQQDFWATPS